MSAQQWAGPLAYIITPGMQYLVPGAMMNMS